MKKIQCPKCRQVMMECNEVICRQLLTYRVNDYLETPYIKGPWRHSRCGAMFKLSIEKYERDLTKKIPFATFKTRTITILPEF